MAPKVCVCVGDEHAHASVGPVAEGSEGSRVGGEGEWSCDDGGVGARERVVSRKFEFLPQEQDVMDEIAISQMNQ